MTQQPTPQEEELVEFMASIATGLKIQRYTHVHSNGFKNTENGGLVMLAQSADEKTHFAIEARIWVPK